jgi:hypothetical protein
MPHVSLAGMPQQKQQMGLHGAHEQYISQLSGRHVAGAPCGSLIPPSVVRHQQGYIASLVDRPAVHVGG